MSSRQVFANEITTNATSQIDLTNNGSGEGDPDLTVKEGITVIKANQNNLVKGYDSDGISTATIIVETGAKIQGKNNTQQSYSILLYFFALLSKNKGRILE